MTQHKSIHVIPPKQWLKKLSGEKGSGTLSATAIFEMAAGAWWMPRMTATDCLMRLAMVMAISITMVQDNGDRDQSENSKSMLCTMVEDLDVDSAQAMVDVRAGIAELASNNLQSPMTSRCLVMVVAQVGWI